MDGWINDHSVEFAGVLEIRGIAPGFENSKLDRISLLNAVTCTLLIEWYAYVGSQGLPPQALWLRLFLKVVLLVDLLDWRH